jgi:hypothetical protein
VNPSKFLSGNTIELLTQSGVVSLVSCAEVKSVFFVREFGPDDPGAGRRTFLSRPKLDGLWVRLAFRDGDSLEAVMPNNLLQVGNEGLHVVPPSGAQRVFVPREALTSVQVLGVVGSPLRPAREKRRQEPRQQIGLFEGPERQS